MGLGIAATAAALVAGGRTHSNSGRVECRSGQVLDGGAENVCIIAGVSKICVAVVQE